MSCESQGLKTIHLNCISQHYYVLLLSVKHYFCDLLIYYLNGFCGALPLGHEAGRTVSISEPFQKDENENIIPPLVDNSLKNNKAIWHAGHS